MTKENKRKANQGEKLSKEDIIHKAINFQIKGARFVNILIRTFIPREPPIKKINASL